MNETGEMVVVGGFCSRDWRGGRELKRWGFTVKEHLKILEREKNLFVLGEIKTADICRWMQ